MTRKNKIPKLKQSHFLILLIWALVGVPLILIWSSCSSSTSSDNEWMLHWSDADNSKSDSTNVVLIRNTDEEILLEGDWEQDGKTGQLRIEATRPSMEVRYYNGTWHEYSDNSSSTNVMNVQLRKYSDECYIGKINAAVSDNAPRVRLYHKGIKCVS